ncbi:MAG: PIN domain-containing protein [Acidobacteria bacterium]|nr:PIN domain-containing protein [Acidobacteriota bacterium]
MICSDTSSFIAFLQGDKGHDVDLITEALGHRLLKLAPVSVTELISYPALPVGMQDLVLRIPLLENTSGYWERAGRTRALLIQHQYRPKIADTLIAQSCLDHDVALITRDKDFAAFQKLAGLRLL